MNNQCEMMKSTPWNSSRPYRQCLNTGWIIVEFFNQNDIICCLYCLNEMRANAAKEIKSVKATKATNEEILRRHLLQG